MTNKQNLAIWKELNEIELERAAYLINSDKLIFETLGESIGHETGKLTKSLHMSVLEDIKILACINSLRQYKCPTCKNKISITKADFISGIAMTSCGDCGNNVVPIKDVLL